MNLQPRTVLTAAIPTLGRTQEVVHTLGLLISEVEAVRSRPADARPYDPDQIEILVSDQNQPPIRGLTQAIQIFSQTYPRIRLTHQSVEPRGVVFNMNAILERAQGEILLFLDDDVDFEPRLIERHLKNYEESSPLGTSLGGVAGRVEQPSGDPDPLQVKFSGRVHPWSGTVVAHFNSLNRQESVDFGPGGNMSYRKEALVLAGGFDEGFDGNGYFFEPDLGLRVVRAGFRIAFDPRASLKHLQAPRGGCRITDKAEHTFYFIKNGTRLLRKQIGAGRIPRAARRWVLTGWIIRSALYSLAKALYNGNFRIAQSGLRGLWIGLRA